MGKYLKLFENHSEYSAFTQTEEFVKPNVSHCIQENEVHYNPYFPPLIVMYNVSDASEPTKLYEYYDAEGQEEYWIRGIDIFDKIEIDGTELSIVDIDATSGKTQLTIGNHTIKYGLKDPTIIKYGAFGDCRNITDITIPNGVSEIGEYAFTRCYSLTSVTFSDTVKTISDSAFAYSTGLTNIIISDSVTTIEGAAFAGCSSLLSIILPNNLRYISDRMLYDCTSLTSITIPNSVTAINDGALEGCSSLVSVVIGNGVTSIGQSVFVGCPNLASVVIGSGVTSIGENAFNNCVSLESVTIPSSVENIGDFAFELCYALSSVTVQSLNPPTLGGAVFRGNAANRKIYVPSQSLNAYKAAEGWSTYAADIEPIE